MESSTQSAKCFHPPPKALSKASMIPEPQKESLWWLALSSIREQSISASLALFLHSSASSFLAHLGERFVDIMKRVDGESFFVRKEDSFFDSAAVFMSQ